MLLVIHLHFPAAKCPFTSKVQNLVHQRSTFAECGSVTFLQFIGHFEHLCTFAEYCRRTGDKCEPMTDGPHEA